MEGYYRRYSNEERLEFAQEVILLIEEYRKYQKEDNVIETMNTYQRLGKGLLLLSNAVFNISTIKRNNGDSFRIEEEGVAESITDAALTMLEKIESDTIDTTGYDEHPEKFISFMKSIIDGKLLNLRKKDTIIYQKETQEEYDEHGQKIDNNQYVSLVSIDQTYEDGKEMPFADTRDVDTDSLFPEELFIRLREILQEIKEHDKDGKYVDYLFGVQKYSKTEIAEILGVSGSLVSRKEKQLREKIAKKLLE